MFDYTYVDYFTNNSHSAPSIETEINLPDVISKSQLQFIHQLEPYAYYVHILKRIPHCQTVEDYQKLLPWNMQLT